jgi:hypothetical protein
MTAYLRSVDAYFQFRSAMIIVLLLLEGISLENMVIKFIRNLWQVGGFLWLLRFPPPIKLTALL